MDFNDFEIVDIENLEELNNLNEDKFIKNKSINEDFTDDDDDDTFKHFRKNNIKKGSYILALISCQNFIKKGAQLSPYGIYYIKKEYDGTPEKETCALIGIPINKISNLLLDDGEVINKIREDKEFEYIEFIDKLTCKFVQNIICKFLGFFNKNAKNDELLLFNIEPKGNGKNEKQYPIPRITIPGGKMEDKDFDDFERCALREFKEETGLDISESHEKLSREKIKKGFRFTHFSSHKKKLKSFCIKNKNDNTKYISMYYLYRIE